MIIEVFYCFHRVAKVLLWLTRRGMLKENDLLRRLTLSSGSLALPMEQWSRDLSINREQTTLYRSFQFAQCNLRFVDVEVTILV